MITAKQIDEAKQKIVNKILADISLSEIIVLIIEKAGYNAEQALKNMSEEEILDMIQKKAPRRKLQGVKGKSTIRSLIEKPEVNKKKQEKERAVNLSVIGRAKEYLKNLLKSNPKPCCKKAKSNGCDRKKKN